MIKPVYDTIVSFGCWNQTHTAEGPSERNKNVMEKLKKIGKDVVLVSGDNYYPVKTKVGGKKIKLVNLDHLKKGFKNLKDATQGTPVYMNFGNHDVVMNDQVDIPETMNTKECLIMNAELEQGNENFHVGMMHKINYSTHTLILMIDTSIYAPKKEFSKYTKCYEEITKLDQKGLVEEQEKFVKSAVESFEGDNVIIVGHYPIFYEKEKEKSPDYQNWLNFSKTKFEKKRILTTDTSEEFTKLLFELPEKKYFYLCADYHVYEEGIITIKKDGRERRIEQYIAGTGGTELDPYTKKHGIITTADIVEKEEKKDKNDKEKDKNDKKDKKDKKDKREYEVVYEHKMIKTQYGFLKGKYENDTGWVFSFVPGEKLKLNISRRFKRTITRNLNDNQNHNQNKYKSLSTRYNSTRYSFGKSKSKSLSKPGTNSRTKSKSKLNMSKLNFLRPKLRTKSRLNRISE